MRIESRRVEITMDDQTSIIERFKALGDPVRWKIITALAVRPQCVCEIQKAVGGIPMNQLSYHLGVLRVADVVTMRRRGRWIDYRLNATTLQQLRENIPTSLVQDFPNGCPIYLDARPELRALPLLELTTKDT